MQERHWHLITDQELTDRLIAAGCTKSRVEELVRDRDTIWGESEIERELHEETL